MQNSDSNAAILMGSHGTTALGRLANRSDELIASVLVSVVSLALPLTLLQVYDRIIPNQSTGTIALLATAVALAIAIELVMRQWRARINAATATAVEHRFARRGFQQLMRADLAAIENEAAGKHLERFNSIGAVRDFHSGQTTQAVQEFSFAAGFLMLVFVLGGALVWVPLVTMICVFLASTVLGVVQARSQFRLSGHEDRLTNFLSAVVEGMFSAKALAVERHLTRRYESLLEARSNAQRRADFYGLLASDISAAFGQIGTAALVSVGSLLVIAGDLSMGALAACTIIAGRAMQPLQSALGIWSRYLSGADARKRTSELFEIPTQAGTADDVTLPTKLTGQLALKGVTYAYPAQEEPVVCDVTLNLEAGETVALTGPNGSGKSTLLLLMRGLLEPQAGQILIDGHDVSRYSGEFLSRNIALVTQREALFEGTILENLTLFRSHYDARAYAVAEMLGFYDEINELPEGFGTPAVGSRLPRGLAQRIAIGRALVEAPRLLLFDDAGSAIDSPSDAALKSVLQSLNGKCTTVIVTHRPSIMQIASRVHDMREGTVEVQGYGVDQKSA